MKNKKFKIILKITVGIVLFMIIFNPVPRIISNKTGKDYVSFLGKVYYKKMNINSPTNHFKMVHVVGAEPRTFVVDNNYFDYSHDRSKYFHQDKEITKEEFEVRMKLLNDSK